MFTRLSHHENVSVSLRTVHLLYAVLRHASVNEVIGNNLSFFLQYKERLVKAFTENVLPYFSGGTSPHLQPLVDSVYPLHEIAGAHRIMEDNKNIGKIVIEVPASS